MKFAAIACLLVAAASVAQALRTPESFTGTLTEEADLASLILSDSTYSRESKEEREEEAFALVKYAVLPSKADGFIEAVKKTKEKAKGLEGYKKLSVVKVLDDNLTYVLWLNWESKGSLLKYIKSEAATFLKEFVNKHDIIYHASPVALVV